MKDIKKNTIISALSLFFQSGYSAVLGLGANLAITILLSPEIFGIYITVLSMISLLNYFSDIGLAASLVQKKEVSDDDIRTTFTIQQILVITIVTLGYLLTGFIQRFYKLPQTGVYLYWALLISFVFSSLKTIPSILLERKIKFQKIVMVQIIENTLFYLTIIILAVLKFGLMSFTFAVLVRSISGLIVIYSIAPWQPKLGFSIVSLKKLLSFGLPFQASSFLALFKDELITLYLGKTLGFTGLGYIGWAKKWAEAPIRIIMDNISRVLFPVIARIQQDKNKVGRLLDKILYYQTILLAPIIMGSFIVMDSFIKIIPRYSKWEPALPLFYLMCISSFLSSYSSPFTNLFNAMGKAKTTFLFMMLWTVSTWIFTPILTHYFGYYGFPMTQVILSLAFILVISKARELVEFHFIKSIKQPIIAAILMGIIISLINLFILNSLLDLIMLIIIGGLIYAFFLQILFKINIIKEIKGIFRYE
ncbi:hypothetical protein AUK04_00110 [Candidatus Roizmanbacteria bacterium CG2_30_33_16]|uniref:Polysaccharide biosynthesis protein C-terminal domain-containing protein n=4 Tax=Candidatus Roizmaniibacteriota TaxID=1752723 RepID=A0A2H0C4G0_9BACT|nr:oligosaccharide flippase family protein [Candidatus Roizmanbacteria bacterium]OIP86766.1 MAG: hypothetical protein AUK04_00110 [Candidatus Roizmanbacteria bacterium CG2_30_33_16]PIP64807.1 MAG: hypothetical protein COW96_00465 [Candidatus Roizmanbacteria bacterium CG22_combo_CG10-13_8_21_14_all_33_16]PIX74204.1 MAG: hypothetical protein COZ39_00810 [Candidatus Roizmanbacteria bacterium CG_4_10_14_3_um_filter_33_21]PJB87824.1 MAG: hypothetical protein CO083_04980 [Candidatus Roizmanbacteria b